MIVEVIGIYERNKGALLMLDAIRAKLDEADLGARLAVPVTMPRAARRRLKVAGVLSAKAGRKTRLLNRLPAWLLWTRGLVKQVDVAVVLDASGFGYGDFWGEAKLRRRLVERLEGWRTHGRAAILLPQALGPFTTPEIAASFRRALELVDLAYVRDNVSMAHVQAVSDSPTIRRAPDFTNLLHPPLPPAYMKLAGSSFVIPNEKMVAGERAADRGAYVRFMALAAEAIEARGLRPRLLVHEGASDRELAAEIKAHAATPLEVIDVASPLDTKALIAAANLIVSSRFHGLVSALAAGVPALACGWSHKYAELMADYGSQGMMAAIDRPETWQQTVTDFLDRAADQAFRCQLSEAAESQRALSRAMWVEAIGVIRSRTLDRRLPN